MVGYILNIFHNVPTSGYVGAGKMRKKIEKQFFWPDMRRDIVKYCDSCTQCALCRRQDARRQAPLQPFPKLTQVFERTAMDIVGPLPVTRLGNKYILVFIDHFSRYAECIPLAEISAKIVAKAFVTNIILRHSVPRQLLTDRGTNFTSKIMKEAAESLGIKRLLTTAYHLACNGVVERLNKTLIDMLAHYVQKDQTQWDEMLQYILFAYNSTTNSSTNESPFYLLYGCDPTYPFDIITDPNTATYDVDENFVTELKLRLKEAHKLAQQHSQAAAEKRKVYHSSKTKPYKFAVGD